MAFALTPREIGQRLLELRKVKDFSQDDVARLVGISRTALTQIELGNRGVDVQELQAFARILEFSLDDFVSRNFSPAGAKEMAPAKPALRSEVRISIPKLRVDKLKQILLYILERCAGKPNIGETVLYKLLYFADFNYYELYEDQLTGAKYRKLPYGPVPQRLDTTIAQMLEAGEIQRIKTKYHGYPQTRFLPLVKPDLRLLKASEKAVIDAVISQYSDWSAAAISAYSHKDLPWLASKEGDDIDYELVFYREPPYSVRNYGDELEKP